MATNLNPEVFLSFSLRFAARSSLFEKKKGKFLGPGYVATCKHQIINGLKLARFILETDHPSGTNLGKER